MAWRTWALLLTLNFIMHSVTVKDLKLVHKQMSILTFEHS